MALPRLHVDAAGAGLAVVLAHGLGGSARNWRPQLRALRPDRRAVAFDARGHARSEAPHGPGAYRLGELVGDFARVLQAEAPEAAVVGGLSLGAAVALELALLHPERVRGLVLASYPAPRAAAVEFADAIESEGLAAAGARFAWGPGSGLDAAGAGLVRAGFLEHAPHAITGLLRECIAALPEPTALEPRLRRFARPVLVVAGERDVGSLAVCRRLAAALPDARLEVVPDAGHVVNLARPDAFNAALLAFLHDV